MTTRDRRGRGMRGPAYGPGAPRGPVPAALTRGVQSHDGLSVTIKHFACNNREDNRMESDSVVPERALRELYL